MLFSQDKEDTPKHNESDSQIVARLSGESLQYLKINVPAFELTPDTDFVVPTKAQQEAWHTLLFAIHAGEGFSKIVGKIGTGKSLLCRRILRELDGNKKYALAYVPSPSNDPNLLTEQIIEELVDLVGIDNASTPLRRMQNMCIKIASAGRSTIILVDEAQTLSLNCLEQLRLISNLESEKKKLMQFILFGQPELERKLGNPTIKQLKQRIGYQYTIGNLSYKETLHYINRRLRIAGMPADAAYFSVASLQLLYKSSQGTPRLINIIASKCLLLLFGEGTRIVRRKHMLAAIHDTAGAKYRLWW